MISYDLRPPPKQYLSYQTKPKLRLCPFLSLIVCIRPSNFCLVQILPYILCPILFYTPISLARRGTRGGGGARHLPGVLVPLLVCPLRHCSTRFLFLLGEHHLPRVLSHRNELLTCDDKLLICINPLTTKCSFFKTN